MPNFCWGQCQPSFPLSLHLSPKRYPTFPLHLPSIHPCLPTFFLILASPSSNIPLLLPFNASATCPFRPLPHPGVSLIKSPSYPWLLPSLLLLQNPARGSGDRCKLPVQDGALADEAFLCIFSSKDCLCRWSQANYIFYNIIITTKISKPADWGPWWGSFTTSGSVYLDNHVGVK